MSILTFLCVGVIIVWPIFNSFFGLDLVDTGYYIQQYDTPLLPYGTYSTYLATLIGALWLKLFDGLGLWGLNLLEIFLEWTLCLIVYHTFKSRFGKRTVLYALTIIMFAISTYVNIFNYHQLNMFFCVTMLCFMYKGLLERNTIFNKKYSMIVSGGACALAVLTRMPSILALLCVLCIIYWGIWGTKNARETIKEIIKFIVGFFVVGIIILGLYKGLGVLDIVISEVFRLGDLGSTSSSTYGMGAMIQNLIVDSLNSSIAALMFGGVFVVLLFEQKVLQIYLTDKKIISCGIFLATCILSIYPIYWAIYRIGGAPTSYIQLTSFNWFLYGICFVTALYYIIKGIISGKKIDVENGVINLMSIALILLCIVGSAARLKHTILGLWIVVPFLGMKIREFYLGEKKLQILKWKFEKELLKPVTVFLCFIALIAEGYFVGSTNNFDSTNYLELNSYVSNEKLRFIRTTEREASAVSGVLEHLEDKKDYPLMVIGNAVMFYYALDMDAFVKPWVTGTSYTAEQYSIDLYTEGNKERLRPIIILCKTEPYEGFSEEKYEKLIEVGKGNTYSGKKVILDQFMEGYEYDVIYENEYFIVYQPDKAKENMFWEQIATE